MGLAPLWPDITTIIADAGHEGRKVERQLKCYTIWRLVIGKRKERAFRITGLTWIVERSFAWLGRNRRPSKDCELKVQASEAMLDAAIRFMPQRLAPTNLLARALITVACTLMLKRIAAS